MHLCYNIHLEVWKCAFATHGETTAQVFSTRKESTPDYSLDVLCMFHGIGVECLSDLVMNGHLTRVVPLVDYK